MGRENEKRKERREETENYIAYMFCMFRP